MSSKITVTSPLTGMIEKLNVENGSLVQAGDSLAILESMKVHVQVKAEKAGTVAHIHVGVGDVVDRDQALIEINQSAASADTTVIETAQHNNHEHASITEFKQRQSLALDAGRPDAVKKRHAKNYRTARENLGDLCDAESFIEYGQFAVAAQRQKHDYESLKVNTAADGIITGIGHVNSDLFDPKNSKTALIVNDYSVLAGTQGFFHHQKLDRILDVAISQHLPVIMFTEGGGGRPNDTDVTTVNSGLQCTSFSAWAGLSETARPIPKIAVANGYNFAGNAALFGAADITIATKQSWIGMAGPAMIEGGGLGTFKPTDIGPIETQIQNGVVDIVADDESHACQLAKQVLSVFQGSLKEWQTPDQSALNSIMPDNRRTVYSVRSVIEQLGDQDSFIELRPSFGEAIVVGFMRLEGRPVGVMANNCASLGGAIDVDAGEKAADFMELCHRFSIPLLSICDTPGFMVGPEHEERGAVRKLAKLFRTGAQFKPPLAAVVLRKCYGLGAQAMLGGHTARPHLTLSWPTGEFGPMGLEGAVKLGFRKELQATETHEERQALYDQLLASQYQRGQAIEVASTLEVDAVIEPAKTRSVLVNALF